MVDYETNVNKRSNINKAIEDLQTTEDDIIIDPGRDDIMLIGIEVSFDIIIHTLVGDLEITLSHNGISESIVYHAGGDGHNFITTRLSDQGVDTLDHGIAPFYGIYKPEKPLSAFLESEPSGIWTLSIYDGVAGNTGTLQSWGLNLIYASAPSAVDDNIYNDTDLVIYPNPAISIISLHACPYGQQSSVGTFVVVEIYNLNGRKLIEKQIPAGNKTMEIDVAGW